MINENQVKSHTNIIDVTLGLAIGSLAGAVAMLLLAPRSGEETRMQIKGKGIELRDRTSGVLDKFMAQIWLDGKKINRSGRKLTKKLLHTSKTLVMEQLDNISDAAKSGKKAIRNS